MSASREGEGSANKAITRITLDPDRNTLRLILADGRVAGDREISAVIDIGEGGRLIGVELDGFTDSAGDPLYLALFSSTESNVRSVTATVYGQLTDSGMLIAIDVPRRGHGYEIAYPSGNQ